MTTSTLYAIGADMEALADLLHEVGGDVSEDDAEAAIDRWLEENAHALGDKLDGYGTIIRQFEERAAFRKAEADRLRALAQTDENNVKRLKDRLRWFFETHGIQKQETARFKFSLAANGGKAPLELLVPPEEIPSAWRTEVVTYRPETDAIREALEKGTELRFARLGERGRHVRLR